MSGPDHLQHLATSPRPLRGLPSGMRVMLVGHGGRYGALPSNRPFATDRLAGLTVRQLADRLQKQGLEKSFDGCLYLASCDGAAGFSNGSSFTQALLAEMSRRGYTKLSVDGLPGQSFVDRAGHDYSIVAALSRDHRLALRQSNRMVTRLEAELKQAHARRPDAPHTAPVPRDTTQVLGRLLRRERAHIEGLKTLQRVDELERTQQIDARGARDQRIKLTAVRDWWGHFGAGTSSKSWLRRQWDRLRGRA